MSAVPYVLTFAIDAYCEWMTVRQYSSEYVDGQRKELGQFKRWCEDRGITHLGEVSRAAVERYQRWLFHYRKKNGKPLGVRSQYMRMGSIKLFLRWAARQRFIDANPASELEMPRLPHRLPQDVLSPRETDLILSQADVNDIFGIRDRAMMEVLYSTGMRRKELVGLLLHDVNHERGTVMIREGKGRRDRVVPIGDRALEWLEKYLSESRPRLAVEPDPQTLFITHTGGAFHPDYVTRMIRLYVEKSGIGKKGSCHLFRHTMATGMLENGADIRFIQAMLGHAKLDTTAIYTKVSIGKLKEIHSATHPASHPTTESPPPTETTADELLEELSAEAISDAE